MKLKNTLVLTISFILSVGLIFSSFAVFNPIRLERERQETLKTVNIYFEDATDFERLSTKSLGDVTVSLALKVMKNQNEELGYLYEANVKNTYGNIKIRVKVDVKERIQMVDLVELNQSMYQSQTTNKAQSYVEQDISKIPDGYAGATSISLHGLMDMMMAIRDVHNSAPKFDIPLPYKDYYGSDYTIISTENITVDDATVKIETISGGLGVVYTVTKSGIKQYGHKDELPITLIVATDATNKIIGVDLPGDLYGHSKGAYRQKALTYALSFVNTNLNDIPDVYASPTTGEEDGNMNEPDNSKRLIHLEFVIAKEVSQ